ncbi:hypothetical protein N7540_006241 [Penicillium herquei]|nr:hypothetical protein N7540_006241 [Penicillium herquei]
MLDSVFRTVLLHGLDPWVLASTALLNIVLFILYRCYFHPLAKYPGPFLAKMSENYMIYFTMCARNTYARHELHQKFGPIVRVGPNELSFSDEASIKDIYGQSTNPCLKAPQFYRGFTMTGTESVFSTRDRVFHARMRRLLANGFSQNGVLQFEAEIALIVQRYLDQIQKSTSQPVEFHDTTHNLFVDITSTLAFARNFNTLGGKHSQGAADIETWFQICPLFGLFPLSIYFPFGLFRAAQNARPRVIEATQSWIDQFRDRIQIGTAENGLLRSMIEARDTETNTVFSDDELIENAVIFVLAGSDTSATTLLYFIYEIGMRPEMQRHLEREIREAFPDRNVMPDYNTAMKLPYLNCVYQEVLRLRGPTNSVPLRISPGKSIGDIFVPSGVMVSNPPYTTHRDPTIFPEPEKFEPSRWENPTQEMKNMHRPFGVGPRNCLGLNLARVQVFITVCALYQRLDMSIDPSMTGDLMKMRDLGLMSPIGRTLKVQVKPPC